TANHTYTTGGTFTAVVTVDDGVNTPQTASATVEIIVVNLPPNVVAGGPYSGTAGQSVQFSASGSSDPESDALSYVWNFGDGSLPTFPSSSAGPSQFEIEITARSRTRSRPTTTACSNRPSGARAVFSMGNRLVSISFRHTNHVDLCASPSTGSPKRRTPHLRNTVSKDGKTFK
ncbi:MAG: PKD domain-containing protein, partial [Chloroflexi bacterium]|nr:PKD domain-containing protein [Chloroflexota bacterium]